MEDLPTPIVAHHEQNHQMKSCSDFNIVSISREEKDGLKTQRSNVDESKILESPYFYNNERSYTPCLPPMPLRVKN